MNLINLVLMKILQIVQFRLLRRVYKIKFQKN
jgi:hypothetical protein